MASSTDIHKNEDANRPPGGWPSTPPAASTPSWRRRALLGQGRRRGWCRGRGPRRQRLDGRRRRWRPHGHTGGSAGRAGRPRGAPGGAAAPGRAVRGVARSRAASVSGGDDEESASAARVAHIDRVADEVRWLPSAPTCANWLRYGVQPAAAQAGIVPGHCKHKAHDRDHLGLDGRRVRRAATDSLRTREPPDGYSRSPRAKGPAVTRGSVRAREGNRTLDLRITSLV